MAELINARLLGNSAVDRRVLWNQLPELGKSIPNPQHDGLTPPVSRALFRTWRYPRYPHARRGRVENKWPLWITGLEDYLSGKVQSLTKKKKRAPGLPLLL